MLQLQPIQRAQSREVKRVAYQAIRASEGAFLMACIYPPTAKLMKILGMVAVIVSVDIILNEAGKPVDGPQGAYVKIVTRFWDVTKQGYVFGSVAEAWNNAYRVNDRALRNRIKQCDEKYAPAGFSH